jgi:TonB family protein
MTARRLLSKVAASATIFSLAITPDIAAACTLYPQIEVSSNHMRQNCRAALSRPKKFLAKVKANAINEWQLRDYVLAFDEGKYGCRENDKFAFRILDNFYSVPERKFSAPSLLQRYAFTWPENHAPVERAYVYNLLWLFSENRSYLPKDWTPEQARAFIERPEHWPIALAKFGNSRDRDDAVFASVSDPLSPHFDRAAVARLSAFSSKHELQRKVVAASLYSDSVFGPADFAVAEKLLPIAGLYANEDSDPALRKAQAIWVQVADGYVQSGNPALREKGHRIREKMSPPTLAKWPTIEKPKDGRVWLSLADWPKSVANPFDPARMAHLITPADYPPRAMRNEETGAVTIAARFGTDGKFSGLEVIQSSGSILLDEAAVKTVNRRFRPKLADMTLTGYDGNEVRVPMLVVDWRVSDVLGDSDGTSSFADGRLSVIASRRMYETDGYSCGWPPSIFV